VAHELRTPLAGIRALAEFGLQQNDPAQWREQLQAIVKSEERASHLMDQLLALAYADEAEQGLPLQALRLDTLVREAVMRHMPKAMSQSVDLGAEGLDEPVWVMGQAALIEGVVGNLVDNALRHGRPLGGASPCVTVGLARLHHPGTAGAGAQVVLSVTDNGPGIDPAQQIRMQARWARSDAQTDVNAGFGFGLSIIKAYAHLLKARLQWEAGPQGTGLRASLALTVVAAPAVPLH
jgi:two-component system sensor histidine kinase TctE